MGEFWEVMRKVCVCVWVAVCVHLCMVCMGVMQAGGSDKQPKEETERFLEAG